MIGARLFRGDRDALDPEPVPLRVRDGRILALGPPALESPGPTEVIDLTGRFVIPGLIDAHVHLELDPTLSTPAEQLAIPDDEREGAMRVRARAMLAQGITTARDCGGGAFREHALRRAIDAGEWTGPRLLCCGQPITTPDGHCAFWGGIASTEREIDAVVARQVEAGSDWIKLMATGGVFTPGSRPSDTQFDAVALAAVVAAANRAGRPVAAHCHGTEGIAAALRAGVRTIEHASFAGPGGFGTAWDDALARELAAREVWVSPTVNAGWLRRIRDTAGEPTDFFRRMSSCLGRQRERGVRFVASTDAGIPGVFHDALAGGLEGLAAYASMRPVEVLRAATVDAAEALGVARETGRIAVGLSADLVVLRGDPTADLARLRDPERVMFRGRWFAGEALRSGPSADEG
ncbi:MAG: amidohydrolase family protein [Deltaproteobacteria bacterium]|nr:amidohydrolase family protein [Deltaproteobacteria bacterium]